tara:strand:- start:109 stop:459 length:351 start_codon:yes stop_codon:yes gene_type:complete
MSYVRGSTKHNKIVLQGKDTNGNLNDNNDMSVEVESNRFLMKGGDRVLLSIDRNDEVDTDSTTVEGVIRTAGVIFEMTTPTSSSDSGTQGQMAVDKQYLYVCIQDNNWRRITFSKF